MAESQPDARNLQPVFHPLSEVGFSMFITLKSDVRNRFAVASLQVIDLTQTKKGYPTC
jgi:hypothetical protein